MAVKDIRSNLLQLVALVRTIASIGTITGAIIDTANFELGLMFSVNVTTFGAGETITLILEESDDSGMSGATVISGDQLIGALPVLTAVVAEGATLETVGVISNKRFVRASISTVTTNSSTIVVAATQKAENMPV
ncbi:MAG: hypothetical protein V3V40_06240 [Nitrosomonadaceae bacterium]